MAPRSASHGSQALAFTLIELLVVIAVITLLAALVTPVIQQALASAERAQCCSNLSQIGKGLVIYARSYDNYLPLNRRAWCGWPRHWYSANVYDEDAAPSGTPAQFDVLGRLFDAHTILDPDVFYCPTDERPRHSLAEWEKRRTQKGSDISCSYLYRGKLESPYCYKLGKLGMRAIVREERLYIHGSPWINVLYGDGAVERFSNMERQVKVDYYNDSLYEDWAALDVRRR